MTNKMGTEKIPKLIFTMALPAIFSMLIGALYNIVDSYYVSEYSQEAFTAISFVFPIQMIMIGVAVGTAVGVNSLIARRLGEKRQSDAENAASHGLLLALISACITTIICLLFTDEFFSIYDMSQITYDMTCTYSYIILGLSFFQYTSIMIERIFQGTGNMLYPMIFNLTGAIINIILDPIFIFGRFGVPELGITGAAIATIIGQICAMILSIIFLANKKNILKLSIKKFKFTPSYVKEIYAVGLPAIVMQTVSSLLTIILNSILIAFSEDAVAVLGIYFKINTFVFMPVFGLTQGYSPVVAFNYGARNLQRMKQAFFVTVSTAFVIMVVGVSLFNFAPGALVSIFTDDPVRYEMGITALKYISLSFFGAAFGIVISSTLQAIGYGFASLIFSLIRQVVLILPIAYVMSKIHGVIGVWIAFPLAEYFAIALVMFMLIRIYKTDLIYLTVERKD